MKMTRRNVLLGALAGSLLGTIGHAFADDLVVVVHRENTNEIDINYVRRIYSGETKSWPDGSPVFPLDQPEDSGARKQFVSSVLGRSLATYRAVWSQNIFTGKGFPPRLVSPDSEMKKIVSSNRNAVGYMSASLVDSGVRIIR